MDFIPSAVAVNIPLPNGQSFPIFWYGILIVTGALVGAYVATLEAKRRDIDVDHVWNGLLVVLVLGVIGARIYHVLSSPSGTFVGLQYYLDNPAEIINFRQGGLGVYGAVAGGAIGTWLYCRYAKLSFWNVIDLAIPGLAFGQAVGRWGNFFNQELYGFPTTLPWGIPIDAAHRLPQFSDLTRFPVETTRFTPTFLYESLYMLAVGFVLLYLARRWSKIKPGDLLLLWAIFYGAGRFLTEFQRPDAWLLSGIATAQIIGLALVVVGAVALMYRHTGPSKAQVAAQTARQRRTRRAKEPPKEENA